MANLKNTVIDDSESITVPAGPSSQRPSSPEIGDIRFNTDLGIFEYFDSTWNNIEDTTQFSPKTIEYNFETGAIPADFTIPDSGFTINGYSTIFGDYSIGSDFDSNNSPSLLARIDPPGWKHGVFPNKVYHYWIEQSSSNGAGIRYFDRDGVEICGFGSDNDEWNLSDATVSQGSTYEIQNAGGYDNIIYVEFTFDWENGTYSYFIENATDALTQTGTQPIRSTKGISYIHLSQHNGESFEDPGRDVVHSYDRIGFEFDKTEFDTPVSYFTFATNTIEYSRSGSGINEADVLNSTPILNTANLQSDNTRVTVPVNGYYRLYFHAHYNSFEGLRNANQYRFAVNGVIQDPVGSAAYIRIASGHNESSANLEDIIYLEEGDQVSIFIGPKANYIDTTTIEANQGQFHLEFLGN